MSVRTIEIADDRRLVLVERHLPAPGPGQVEIEVAYCGICGSDLPFRDIPTLFPSGTVPGHELSGAVSVGALVYRRTEFAAAIDLLAERRIPTDGLITDIVPLDRAEAMFQALTAPDNAHMKVLLEP